MRDGLLKAVEVGQIRGRRCLDMKPFVHFRGLPSPVLHVPVEKGEITAQTVSVRWQGPPILTIRIIRIKPLVINPSRLIDHEDTCINALLVLVDEGKHARRGRNVVASEIERAPGIKCEDYTVPAINRIHRM